MTKRAPGTDPVAKFASMLSDMRSRLARLETIAHSHGSGGSGGGSSPNSLVPIGTIVETILSGDPSGYLLLDGRAITDADTEYPALWAVAPGGWKSGTTLTLSNRANMMIRAT